MILNTWQKVCACCILLHLILDAFQVCDVSVVDRYPDTATAWKQMQIPVCQLIPQYSILAGSGSFRASQWGGRGGGGGR